jgi:NTE family protein
MIGSTGSEHSGIIPRSRNSIQHPWRHLYGWLGAIRTRIIGSPGQFHPRVPSMNPLGFRSLYDLTPMKERLAKLIDFGHLNSGEVRICVAATEIDTAEPVLFDSRKDRIEMDHLLASCGFLPEFAPVEVGGQLLGDGGLSLNAPFDPIMESELEGDLLLYVIDLYARDGERPASLEAAAERKTICCSAIRRLSGLNIVPS